MSIFLAKCRIGLFDLFSFNVSFNRWKPQKFYIPAPLFSFLQNVHNIPVKSVIVTITVWFVVTSKFAEFPRRTLQMSPFSEMWIHKTGAKWWAFRRDVLSPVLNRRIIKKKAALLSELSVKCYQTTWRHVPITRCLQVQFCRLSVKPFVIFVIGPEGRCHRCDMF